MLRQMWVVFALPGSGKHELYHSYHSRGLHHQAPTDVVPVSVTTVYKFWEAAERMDGTPVYKSLTHAEQRHFSQSLVMAQVI